MEISASLYFVSSGRSGRPAGAGPLGHGRSGHAQRTVDAAVRCGRTGDAPGPGPRLRLPLRRSDGPVARPEDNGPGWNARHADMSKSRTPGGRPGAAGSYASPSRRAAAPAGPTAHTPSPSVPVPGRRPDRVPCRRAERMRAEHGRCCPRPRGHPWNTADRRGRHGVLPRARADSRRHTVAVRDGRLTPRPPWSRPDPVAGAALSGGWPHARWAGPGGAPSTAGRAPHDPPSSRRAVFHTQEPEDPLPEPPAPPACSAPPDCSADGSQAGCGPGPRCRKRRAPSVPHAVLRESLRSRLPRDAGRPRPLPRPVAPAAVASTPRGGGAWLPARARALPLRTGRCGPPIRSLRPAVRGSSAFGALRGRAAPHRAEGLLLRPTRRRFPRQGRVDGKA
ncbi:hypothetical protein HRbin39_01219 [bacterium HR39]|nr:hypothetical protein HRbin39_01219 [bacterium HR39]